MAPILTALTFIRNSRATQAVLVVIACGLAAWIILKVHDAGVRREAIQSIETKARSQEADARNRADEGARGRNEAYDETRVDNAASVDEYLRSLRANQCRANPAACRETEVR